jgi:UDP-N-acetylmuramoylalanine--D-glutamate ligase
MEYHAIKTLLKKQFALDDQASKVMVVGLGDTGVSVAYYLQRLGFKFAICDSRKTPPVTETFYQDMVDIPVFTGGFDEEVCRMATHLIVSPGIALTENAITSALNNGATLVSDIDLFVCSVDAPIIAITGSNGKSTVTSMLGDMVKAAGKTVAVGGNIGIPALDLLSGNAEEDEKAEIYVLELSSFQLERTTALDAAAATVLNISADHLDRHADISAYVSEKEKIFKGQGYMIINADDAVVRNMIREGRKTFTFSIVEKADFYLAYTGGLNDDDNSEQAEYLMYADTRLMPLSELPLEGRHNAANALAALALGTALGLNQQAMCKALKKFKGLDHRMQRVAQLNGVTWVNDSKATNIGACIAALQGYKNKVILIAGGDAKGADMNELTPTIKEKAKGVVLLGKDAKLIEVALNGCVPVYAAENMVQAVQIAARLASNGDSVLLSPACASLDQYKNYKDRGDKFKKAVLELMA